MISFTFVPRFTVGLPEVLSQLAEGFSVAFLSFFGFFPCIEFSENCFSRTLRWISSINISFYRSYFRTGFPFVFHRLPSVHRRENQIARLCQKVLVLMIFLGFFSKLTAAFLLSRCRWRHVYMHKFSIGFSPVSYRASKS